MSLDNSILLKPLARKTDDDRLYYPQPSVFQVNTDQLVLDIEDLKYSPDHSLVMNGGNAVAFEQDGVGESKMKQLQFSRFVQVGYTHHKSEYDRTSVEESQFTLTDYYEFVAFKKSMNKLN